MSINTDINNTINANDNSTILVSEKASNETPEFSTEFAKAIDNNRKLKGNIMTQTPSYIASKFMEESLSHHNMIFDRFGQQQVDNNDIKNDYEVPVNFFANDETDLISIQYTNVSNIIH